MAVPLSNRCPEGLWKPMATAGRGRDRHSGRPVAPAATRWGQRTIRTTVRGRRAGVDQRRDQRSRRDRQQQQKQQQQRRWWWSQNRAGESNSSRNSSRRKRGGDDDSDRAAWEVFPGRRTAAAALAATALAAAAALSTPADISDGLSTAKTVAATAWASAAEEVTSKATEYVRSGDEPFDAMSYVGRWYEVASLKTGFAGEGQQDCHCTQGIYMPRSDPTRDGGIRLDVSTFCVHGSPAGRVSGITGDVSCADPKELALAPEFETPLEREERIKEKCVLRFPSIPFVPPEPYDVIRTDYTSYALVQGSKDRSFVQIYSRTPDPGAQFIRRQKRTLAELGYAVDKIRDTPQDCPVVPIPALMDAMKTGSEMDSTMKNTMPANVKIADLLPPEGTAFAGPRNPLDSVKDLFGLFNQEVTE